MRGLLFDVNIQSHRAHFARLLDQNGLSAVFAELGVSMKILADLKLPLDIDDRSLWYHCQSQDFVLLTDNRNEHGSESLQATLVDSWMIGNLPVLTLSSKTRLARDRAYAQRVAADIADVLFGVFQSGEFRDQARVWIPR